MESHRKRRVITVIAVMLICGLGGAMLLMALRSHIELYLTPTQLLAQQSHLNHTFRLGGFVVMDSVQVLPNQNGIVFQVSDLKHEVKVHYKGILPALFKPGKGVVLSGMWHHGQVEASEVLAKHDENYRPPGLIDPSKIKSSQLKSVDHYGT